MRGTAPVMVRRDVDFLTECFSPTLPWPLPVKGGEDRVVAHWPHAEGLPVTPGGSPGAIAFAGFSIRFGLRCRLFFPFFDKAE